MVQLRGTQSFSGLIFPTARQDFTGYTNTPSIQGSWNFLDLTAKGTWSPVVDSVRPLAEAEAGYEALAADHYGKLVLAVPS